MCVVVVGGQEKVTEGSAVSRANSSMRNWASDCRGLVTNPVTYGVDYCMEYV